MLLLWSLFCPLSADIVIKIPIVSETTTATSKFLTYAQKMASYHEHKQASSYHL